MKKRYTETVMKTKSMEQTYFATKVCGISNTSVLQ